MNELKDLNLGELVALRNERRDMWIASKCPDFREDYFVLNDEILSRVAETAEVEEVVEIEVHFEIGYRWTVSVKGEDESRGTGLTKKEAMGYARQLKKEAVRNGSKAVIIEQKLSKEERAENMSDLHENSSTFNLK